TGLDGQARRLARGRRAVVAVDAPQRLTAGGPGPGPERGVRRAHGLVEVVRLGRGDLRADELNGQLGVKGVGVGDADHGNVPDAFHFAVRRAGAPGRVKGNFQV